MIDYKYQDLFLENSIKKNLIIKFDGGEISNSDIFYETMELTESICSDNQIAFGNCEASIFKITIANINVPLEGKWITVSTILDDKTDEPFVFGTYKVASFKPTADRSRRELVAYDAIKDILSADMTDWYNGLAFPMSLKKFRDSFFDHLGFEQEETTLTNDEMVVEKTIESDEISGKYIINAICEINGCFGHVNRNNKFQYLEIAFNQFGLYPRNDIYPADDLYPVEPSGRKIANNLWISCEYEDYIVEKIDTLQIRQEENDIGVIIGNGENLYVIQDNFLVYGKNSRDLEQIAENTFNIIKDLSKYRPFSAECLGNPCIEVGDAIRITAKSEIIESYVLRRTLKGIQSLRDTYKADGQKVRSQNLNSTQKSIKQLKGKTNVLERSIEETKSFISDVERGLQSQITQNANSITSEVKRATETEGNLSSRIMQNAESISLKVSKGNVSSEISTESGQVSIKSNRLIVDSTQFKLDGSGNAVFGGTLSAASGSFSGSVSATNGTFDNVIVNGSCTVAGESISGSIGSSKSASWAGDAISNAKIASSLSGKSFSGCSVPSGNNLGFGGSQIASGATISMISSSAIHMKTSNGKHTVFSALNDGVTIRNLTVSGSKSRVIETTFGNICLDAYETPTPMFGDVGEGVVDEDGQIYIFIDQEFYESIESEYKYKIFLTPYGPGQLYADMKSSNNTFFVVKGTPGLEFAWEIKALQKDMKNTRFRNIDYKNFEESNTFEYDVDNVLNEEEQEAMNYV